MNRKRKESMEEEVRKKIIVNRAKESDGQAKKGKTGEERNVRKRKAGRR